MSGFLEVKLPTSFKKWKKQWCILRPNPGKNSIVIIFHTTKSTSSNSQIEIPFHSIVYRTNFNAKKYTFGIFLSSGSHKLLLHLAGQSETDAQFWISRLRMMLSRDTFSIKNDLKEHEYSVSLIDNDFTNICNLKGLHGTLTMERESIKIFNFQTNKIDLLLKFSNISNVKLVQNINKIDNEKVIIIKTNSKFPFGEGEIIFFCPSASNLYHDLQSVYEKYIYNFYNLECTERHTKWYCGLENGKPNECVSGQKDLLNHAETNSQGCIQRDSIASIKSGIYEEISEEILQPSLRFSILSQEHLYEPLKNCTNIDLENKCPPPLPPRYKLKHKSDKIPIVNINNFYKQGSSSLNVGENDKIMFRKNEKNINHEEIKTMPKHSKFQSAIGVFRNRVKSESSLSRNKNLTKNTYQSNESLNKISLFFGKIYSSTVKLKQSSSPLKNYKADTCGSLKQLQSVISDDPLYSFSNDSNKRNSKSAENLDTILDNLDKSDYYKYAQSIDNLDLIQNHCNISLLNEYSSNKSDEDIKDLSLLYMENVCELTLDKKDSKSKQFLEEDYVQMSPSKITLEILQRKKPDILTENNYVVMKGK